MAADSGTAQLRKTVIDDFRTTLSSWDTLYLQEQLRKAEARVAGFASSPDNTLELAGTLREEPSTQQTPNCSGGKLGRTREKKLRSQSKVFETKTLAIYERKQ